MPSPIGHGLIGCATGILFFLPRSTPGQLAERLWQARWNVLGCAAVANAPDIDFVPGLIIGQLNAFHHGPTHSLGWAILVALAVGGLVRAYGPGNGRAVAGVVWVLITGHLAADWLCQDLAAPYGIMVFWPVDQAYWLSPVALFQAMQKATLADVFSWANLGPAWRELWVGTLCIAVALTARLRWSHPSDTPDPSPPRLADAGLPTVSDPAPGPRRRPCRRARRIARQHRGG